MRRDDRIALGIERDGADVGPVARGARPARWVEIAGLEEQGVASGQDGHIFTRMALCRADVAIRIQPPLRASLERRNPCKSMTYGATILTRKSSLTSRCLLFGQFRVRASRDVIRLPLLSH